MLCEPSSATERRVVALTDAEFAKFQRFIFDAAGITMGPSKKSLVMGRLGKRLALHGLERFADYFALLSSGQHPQEVQMAVDLLTTNETYFFREAKHFEVLRARALSQRRPGQTYRVWSAASSTGEEAYSTAMVLDDCMGTSPWEVLGTDISTRVLQDASRAVFSLERARHVSKAYLQRYCLRGTEEYEGRLLIERSLRSRVRFAHLNLNEPLPQLGEFDFIFLRNVMIYFSDDTKRQVVSRVLATLRPGGIFCIGHSESLNGLTDAVQLIAPSVYQKPA